MKLKILSLIALTIIVLNAKAQVEGIEFGADLGIGYINGTDKRINGNIGINVGVRFPTMIAMGLFFTHLNTNSKEDNRLGSYFDDLEFLYRSNYTGVYFKKSFFEDCQLQLSAFVKGGIGGTNYSNHVITDKYKFFEEEDEDEENKPNFHLHEKADKCFVTVVEPGASFDIYFGGGVVLSLGATYRKYGNLKLYCDGNKIAAGDDLDGVTIFIGIALRTN